MTLTLCGLPGSPFYRKIMTVLLHKGLPFETEMLSPFQAGDDFTAINPMRRIPILKDSDMGDDFILADSSVMVLYLEKKHPEKSLLPDDLADYGRALWFEEYADTEMASTIGLGIFRPVIFPQRQKKEPDIDAALSVIRGKLIKINDYIESQLDGKDWLVGGAFTIADIAVGVQYGNLAYTGYAPSAERWPNIAAFLKRLGDKEHVAKPYIQAATAFATMKKIEIDPAEGL